MENRTTINQETIRTKFEGLMERRITYYLIALIIRIILGLIFIDMDDGPVFFETGYDIIIRRTSIYNEDSLQNRFNYFPLAYLAILPGQLIYYSLKIDNLYLQRLLMKLPLILGDLFLAYKIVNKQELVENKELVNLNEIASNKNKVIIHPAELFILFNPFIIFTSSIKGQFDIFPVIFLLLGWRQFEQKQYFKSGILVGISIMFKQYGVLFSFILGIHLIKKHLSKLHKFIIGHIVGVFPVLLVAALINLDGLIYHAIVFHLNRPPSGYSATSIFYYPITIISRINYSSLFAVVIGNIIVTIFKAVLIFVLLFLGFKLWVSSNTDIDVIRTLALAYLTFFLFNNVLWTQYFAIFMVLWVEYKFLIGETIPIQSIHWNYVVIPLSITFRVANMTPIEVQQKLGTYWLELIWFVTVITHFLMMYYYTKRGVNFFKYKYAKILYVIILIILPIHFLAMSNFFTILDRYIF